MHPLLTRLRAVSWPLKALAAVAACFLAGILVVLLMAAWYYPQLPSLEKVIDYQPRQPLQVFSRDGVELAQFGAERRQFVPIAQIPKLLQDAVISVEDARFREHGGIDAKGVLRAVVANLTPGGMRQGASTITQQVARTFFLTKRLTAERKIKEAMLALKIEQQLDKDKILELYLNQIFLGHRTYGFAAAAQTYFGKRLDELTVGETAMLAGLPQNPYYANPLSNMERARARQLVVLQRMRTVGVIDDAQLAAAQAEKLVARPAPRPVVHAEYVAEMARQVVHERYGEQAYTQGLHVYTSIIATDQQAAYEALRRGVLAYERKQAFRGPEDQEDLPESTPDEAQAAAKALQDYDDDEDLRVAIVTLATPRQLSARLATGEEVQLNPESLRWARAALAPRARHDLAIHRGSIIRVVQVKKPKGEPAWTLAQWPQVQGAFVSLDPGTGRVRALVGGFDFSRGQFNRATSAQRQPGSSFKPFLYSAALEHGVMPATLVNDAPFSQGNWSPQNADGNFDGPITLRQALARSKNMVSIRVLQQIGVGAALDWTSRFGFAPDKQPDSLALALGAGSTTPLQLASAYAVFANGGFPVTPTVIERITDAEGKVIYEAPLTPAPTEATRVIPERNVFMVDSLLQEVTRGGTAARAQQSLRRPDIYGKTGTTNDAVDAWFAGFQPSVVAVVWMGYDDPKSLGSRESGGGLSLPVWIDYMGKVLKGVPVRELAPPASGVVRAEVNGVDDWVYAEAQQQGELVERIDVEERPWWQFWEGEPQGRDQDAPSRQEQQPNKTMRGLPDGL
ncbi:MAG: PBP1A family penicillin-binding protein [Aquabacterium sp.]|nr:MAG: PBP1A family penicillin-binding protein [Aquabacterium sp.]